MLLHAEKRLRKRHADRTASDDSSFSVVRGLLKPDAKRSTVLPDLANQRLCNIVGMEIHHVGVSTPW
jgi:hypothetical protein